MPSLLTETQNALGGENLPTCDSRSLRLTRYANPEPGKQRKTVLDEIVSPRGKAPEAVTKIWNHWIESLNSKQLTILYARLEARLLINMGGSVMENAGLNLDRYGNVYIPGSAIKACARRAAIAALRQWSETGTQPEAGSGDALARVAAGFESRESFFEAIVRTFGYTDVDWKCYDPNPAGGPKSDLAWACGDDLLGESNQWQRLKAEVLRRLTQNTSSEILQPSHRGSIAFLPSYPLIPSDLQLDVLTSHHPEYYKGFMERAEDVESPIPVYFPAGTAGTIYAFPMHLLVEDPRLLTYASQWLAAGLSVFGLGAKTAAGYGWFEVDETNRIQNAALDSKKREACLAKTRKTLIPDSELLAQLSKAKEDVFRGRLNPYSNDPRNWPAADSETIQLTLLVFATEVSPTLWNNEKSNARSKINRAVRALAAKFNRSVS